MMMKSNKNKFITYIILIVSNEERIDFKTINKCYFCVTSSTCKNAGSTITPKTPRQTQN